MNVLICTSKSSYTGRKVGGAETSMRLLAEVMASQGQEVTYITGSDNFVARAGEQMINAVRVVFLPSVRNIRFGRRLPLWLVRRIDLLTGSLRRISGQSDLKCTDIVYLFYQLDYLRFFLKQRSRLGFRVVMRMAGLDWYEQAKRRPALKGKYEMAFASVDSINYISSGLIGLCSEAAEEVGIRLAPRDSFVLDVGVHPALADFTWKGSDDPAFMHAICVGRFSDYQKRQDLLVEAVALLHETGTITTENFRLVFIGEGSERQRIERMIVEHHLEPICRVESNLPQQRLWETMQTADLLCHPCEYEGLGKIIAESMLIGLPVLASDVTPLNEILEHRSTGFLTSNTPETWSNALSELLYDPELRDSVSSPSRDFARQHYDPYRNGKRYALEFQRITRSFGSNP